jgi:hypothetical protein
MLEKLDEAGFQVEFRAHAKAILKNDFSEPREPNVFVMPSRLRDGKSISL